MSSNLNRGLMTSNYSKMVGTSLWEHISIGDEDDASKGSNGTFSKQCQRKVFKGLEMTEELQSQINEYGREVVLGESIRQQKEEKAYEGNIEDGCGSWADNIGDLSKQQEIFRGEESEVYKLLEDTQILKKRETGSAREWKIGSGVCTQESLGNNRIEIICQRTSTQETQEGERGQQTSGTEHSK
ncbi:hypothetical protein [Mycoplasma suis]|nr:hypothetical protein [Mycoplasma suis]